LVVRVQLTAVTNSFHYAFLARRSASVQCAANSSERNLGAMEEFARRQRNDTITKRRKEAGSCVNIATQTLKLDYDGVLRAQEIDHEWADLTATGKLIRTQAARTQQSSQHLGWRTAFAGPRTGAPRSIAQHAGKHVANGRDGLSAQSGANQARTSRNAQAVLRRCGHRPRTMVT
jgi:hypothetical protein